MYNAVCQPILLLVATEHSAVITITVEMADAIFVLQIMVEEHGQQEVARSL